MAYAKIDHALLTDELTFDLPAEAGWLFVQLIVWSSREESDGHVPAKVCRKLGKKRALLRLISVGLVSEVGPSVVVNNYLKYNTSKADIAAKRDLAKARVTRYQHNQSTENRVQRTKDKELKVKKRASAPKAKKWTVVPESWTPNGAHIAKAESLRLPFDKELNKFRQWEFKDPKSDADRAFHRWLDMASERRAAGPRPGGFVPHEAPKNKRERQQEAEIHELMKDVRRESVG